MTERKTPADYPLLQEGKLWEVDRENILVVAGGQRALLMQVAHPLVAHAVEQFSDFQNHPIKRLIRTLDSTYNVIFGATDESASGSQRIGQAHRRVDTSLPEDVGMYPAGTHISPRDPALSQWVWGTLVDSALYVYERYVKPVSDEYKESYYQEAKAILPRVGGKATDAPATYKDFAAYMDDMHQGGKLVVGKDAKELAPHILLQTSVLTRRPSRPFARIAVGSLREPLRQEYGDFLQAHYGVAFAGERSERLIDRASEVSRKIHPRLPEFVRFSPKYRRARRRMR